MINGTETVHRHRENTIAVGLKCIAESGTMYLSREQESSITLLIFTTMHLRHVVIVRDPFQIYTTG